VTKEVMTMATVNTRRRVVRRRAQPAYEACWATVLEDVDPVLHPAIRAYVETTRAAYEARIELTTVMTRSGGSTRWADVDRLVRPLLS
jgi:hypothetical protein